jgi:hypothetical protein
LLAITCDTKKISRAPEGQIKRKFLISLFESFSLPAALAKVRAIFETRASESIKQPQQGTQITSDLL